MWRYVSITYWYIYALFNAIWLYIYELLLLYIINFFLFISIFLCRLGYGVNVATELEYYLYETSYRDARDKVHYLINIIINKI